MGYSIKLKIDSHRPRKDLTCAIYLQVIIDRKKLHVGLDLTWPVDKFDENGGCKPRMKKDPLVNDYNIIINNARAKANQIIMDYRIKDKAITIDLFEKEYYSKISKVDFIQYFEAKSKERWGRREISDSTFKHEKMVLGKLKAFSPTGILFREITNQWAIDFDVWLKTSTKERKKLRTNSRWGVHKVVKTYMIMATKINDIEFVNPYNFFKNVTEESELEPLTKDDLRKLTDYYFSDDIKQKESIVLRRFLFACATALRISDLKSLTTDNFTPDGKMTVKPVKTEKYGTKVINKPLNDLAIVLLGDEIKEATDRRLFHRYNEQYSNDLLKQIAKNDKVGIDRRIYHHVGRATFASLYDQAGGNHRSLMEYMGLKKMNTLMRYVKTNEKVIADAISKMNNSLADAKISDEKKRIYLKANEVTL